MSVQIFLHGGSVQAMGGVDSRAGCRWFMGALVAWVWRILSVLFTASTCDYLCGFGWAAWFGGVGWRHGVAMIVQSRVNCADTIGLMR